MDVMISLRVFNVFGKCYKLKFIEKSILRKIIIHLRKTKNIMACFYEKIKVIVILKAPSKLRWGVFYHKY